MASRLPLSLTPHVPLTWYLMDNDTRSKLTFRESWTRPMIYQDPAGRSRSAREPQTRSYSYPLVTTKHLRCHRTWRRAWVHDAGRSKGHLSTSRRSFEVARACSTCEVPPGPVPNPFLLYRYVVQQHRVDVPLHHHAEYRLPRGTRLSTLPGLVAEEVSPKPGSVTPIWVVFHMLV
jgi:hypothetical protein